MHMVVTPIIPKRFQYVKDIPHDLKFNKLTKKKKKYIYIYIYMCVCVCVYELNK